MLTVTGQSSVSLTLSESAPLEAEVGANPAPGTEFSICMISDKYALLRPVGGSRKPTFLAATLQGSIKVEASGNISSSCIWQIWGGIIINHHHQHHHFFYRHLFISTSNWVFINPVHSSVLACVCVHHSHSHSLNLSTPTHSPPLLNTDVSLHQLNSCLCLNDFKVKIALTASH